MVGTKRLAQMAKKWQRMAALGRKRLWSTTRPNKAGECYTSVAVEGHCVVYTTDGRRFEVPLAYLDTMIISEFLRMSQEEFGFTSDGRIMLPFDARLMEYAMCLLRRNASEEVESAFVSSVVRPCNLQPSMSLSQQVVVCSF